MSLPQRLTVQTDSSANNSVNSADLLTETTVSPAETEPSTATEKRKPLLFEPEPIQRMVVVRRRKRRRSQRATKAEQTASRVRLVLFGLVVILLLVAVSGQHFAQALLQQLKDLLRPVKGALHAPKLEVVALVIAGLILLYLMPGVEGKIKRWLGIGSDPKQKTR